MAEAAQGGKASVVAAKPPPLLIGMVFNARRVIHISTSEKMGADAQLSFGEELMKRLGVRSGFRISGGAKGSSSYTVDLVGEESVPVAFAPAFVVTGTRQLAEGQTSYELASVDPEILQTEIQYARNAENKSIAEFAQAVKERNAQFVYMTMNPSASTVHVVVTRTPPKPPEFVAVSKQEVWRSVLRLDGGA